MMKFLRVLWSIWAVSVDAAVLIIFSCLVMATSLLGFGEKTIAYVGRVWASLTVFLAGVRVRVRGRGNLQPGENYIFAGNHASAADIPIMQSILPTNFRWIAKEELFRFPIFGPALRAAGYIPVNRASGREAMRSLAQAATRIATGASVVLFPEGTRTADGTVLPFKSGGLSLAIKSKRPVVPFYIHGSFRVMPPKQYLIIPGRVVVHIGEPVPTDGLKSKDRDQLAQEVYQRVLDLRARALEDDPALGPKPAAAEPPPVDGPEPLG